MGDRMLTFRVIFALFLSVYTPAICKEWRRGYLSQKQLEQLPSQGVVIGPLEWKVSKKITDLVCAEIFPRSEPSFDQSSQLPRKIRKIFKRENFRLVFWSGLFIRSFMQKEGELKGFVLYQKRHEEDFFAKESREVIGYVELTIMPQDGTYAPPIHIPGAIKHFLAEKGLTAPIKGYCANLILHPTFRKQGLTDILGARCRAEFKRWGYDEYYFHTIGAAKDALRLYNRMGCVEAEGNQADGLIYFKGTITKDDPVIFKDEW